MKAETVSRVGSGISLPMALLLIIFFFLPWLNVNCSIMSFAEASGWQLTVGDLSPTDMIKEKMGTDEQEKSDENMPDARPWFILGLLAPVAILIAAALGAAGAIKSQHCGRLLIVLAAIGIIVIILAANVEYGELTEKMVKDKSSSSDGDTPFGPSDKEMSKMAATQISTSGTKILWWSLTFYIATLVCGGVVLLSPLITRAVTAVVKANTMTPGSPPAGPPTI